MYTHIPHFIRQVSSVLFPKTACKYTNNTFSHSVLTLVVHVCFSRVKDQFTIGPSLRPSYGTPKWSDPMAEEFQQAGSGFTKHFHMANGGCKQTWRMYTNRKEQFFMQLHWQRTFYTGFNFESQLAFRSINNRLSFVQLGACLGSCVYEIMAQSGLSF